MQLEKEKIDIRLIILNLILWIPLIILLIFIIGISKVEAQIIREGSVSNASNTKLYTSYNFTQMTYTGQWSYLSLYYDISGSSGQNILFSTNYQVLTNNPNVGRISMSIWYIGTDGSWNQIIDNCQRSGTRTDGQNSSMWDLQIVCNIPTTKNFSEIAVSINLLNSSGQNMNSPYLRFIQKSSSVSTSGTSNQAIGDMIINNDDKNTSIIINNNDANTEKIINSYEADNQPNTNTSDSAFNKEGQILNSIDTNIQLEEFTIDTTSNNLIWEWVHRLLFTNTIVAGTIIALLTLGVIKLILGR